MSPNGSTSTKIVPDDLVKCYIHVYLSGKSCLFFSPPCFLFLQTNVTSAPSCSRTLCCPWACSPAFHLPLASCCQRQAGSPPPRHTSSGISLRHNHFLECQSLHTSSACSAHKWQQPPWAKS